LPVAGVAYTTATIISTIATIVVSKASTRTSTKAGIAYGTGFATAISLCMRLRGCSLRRKPPLPLRLRSYLLLRFFLLQPLILQPQALSLSSQPLLLGQLLLQLVMIPLRLLHRSCDLLAHELLTKTYSFFFHLLELLPDALNSPDLVEYPRSLTTVLPLIPNRDVVKHPRHECAVSNLLIPSPQRH
jgi:hypothetical protein